jgi:phosphosulfolactate phosphohydrolase-like enzyme
VTGNAANGGNTTANLNTTGEALYLAGTNGEGVVDTSLLAATTVAAEFNAEFTITASTGQDALLVVNATDSTRFALYSYLESGSGAEIQGAELTLIGVFNSNGDIVTSQFGLI